VSGAADPSGAFRGGDPRALLERIVEQRYSAALGTVAQLRAEHPDATADELANRLIRQCARDLAVGGAMSGGAAASPIAGLTVAAATLGAEATYGVSRLGEMVMALGIVQGFEHSSAGERVTWVAAALGASEGAAIGLTGVAARAGAIGGARVLRRLPSTGTALAGAGRTRRMAGRLASRGGPWSLAALVPYGIGAGVGAASNAALAWSVGRTAKRYFALHGDPGSAGAATGPAEGTVWYEEEIWEAEVVEERILDDDEPLS
jgi:hypothetical protein